MRIQRIASLLLAITACAFAQSSLRGHLYDESGSFIRGGTVVLTGANGAAQAAVSGSDGSYQFLNLTSGDYSVSASAPQLSMEPVKVSLQGGNRVLDLRLRVAATTQQVTVNDTGGPAVAVDASSNANALVLKDSDLDALADDPDDLQADLLALAGPSAGPGGGSFFIDGFSGGELPPKQSIREVRVNQNPFSPENDKLGLGKIEIFTKPGSDKYRGSIAYNLGTDVWNARNPYAADKGKLLLNEFENSGGGPLGKRASFALSLDRQMVDNGSIVNGVTLSDALQPQAFSSVITTPQRRFSISPRIDYQVNENNTVTLRYTYTQTDVKYAGIGAFDLGSRGDERRNKYNTVQFTETSVHGALVNETRFQYYRWQNNVAANSNDPAILVLGAFNGGGGQMGIASDLQTSYEFQNYTTMVRGRHTFRGGVRLRALTDDNLSPQNFTGAFTFSGAIAPQLDANNQPIPGTSIQISGIEQYRRATLFQRAGLSPAAAALLGGGASQFSINGGNPAISGNQIDAGVFFGDDWRARPNLTFNFGVRYEAQTNINDHADWAPRIGLAWAPGGGSAKTPKTVLRAGFGFFYDRFGLGSTLNAERFNGVNEQQFVVTNPTFYPAIPALSTLAANRTSQVIREIDSNLRAPLLMQTALTVERQLPRSTTLAVTYTNSRAMHTLRSIDINAPLPGSYNPADASSGLFPYGTRNPLFLATSSGVYRQNQMIVNVNTKVNNQVSFSGSYTLNHAESNSDGLGTFPANPYNYSGEYGPASSDIHHRVQLTGTLTTRWNVRFSPNVTVQSGSPFDLTAGSDLYGTTLFNGRPGFATDASKTGVVMTAYGLLDPTPTAGEQIVRRNSGRGPGQASVNLRVGKTFVFGEGKAAASGGVFSSPATGRYNLSISMGARNLLNHNNPGPIVGNITSPLFGRANQVAGGPNGEGFSENASNRRLELQIRLQF
jgi:hypothetical protein